MIGSAGVNAQADPMPSTAVVEYVYFPEVYTFTNARHGDKLSLHNREA